MKVNISKDNVFNLTKRYISIITFILAVIVYIAAFQIVIDILIFSEKSPSHWKEWQHNFLNNSISIPSIETEDNVYKYKYNFEELKKDNEFNTDFAYSHLLRFGTKVHSYNTDEIKNVENYIISYIEALQQLSIELYEKNIIEYDFDRRTNMLSERAVGKSAFRSGNQSIYFEASNILVRIHPLSFTLSNNNNNNNNNNSNNNNNNTIKSYNKPALLFSAHHDSQSTSHGASDNGMSVVTLLESLRLSILNPPKTVDFIYNFNSAEEKGLFGSKSFLLHEWKKDVKGFINLEASGSGNRGMLFQSSSNIINKAFSKSPHPHSSVIGFTAFKLRIISSNTDFQIYNAANIPGVDFAIYSNRAVYHTYKDDISRIYLKSLKVFGESVCSAINTLGNSNEIEQLSEPEDGGVFFDVFGYFSEVFTFNSYIVISLVILILQFISMSLIIIKTIYYNKNKSKNKLSRTIRLTIFPILRGFLAIIVAILLYAALTIASNYFWTSGQGMAAHSFSDYVFASYTFLGLVCLSIAIYLWSWYENKKQFELIEPILIQSSSLFWLLFNLINIVLLFKKLGPLYFINILSVLNFIYTTIHGLLFKYNYPISSVIDHKQSDIKLINSNNNSNTNSNTNSATNTNISINYSNSNEITNNDITFNNSASNDILSKDTNINNDNISNDNKYSQYFSIFSSVLLFITVILSNLIYQEIVIVVFAGLTQTIPTGTQKGLIYYLISIFGAISSLISINLIPKLIRKIPIKMIISFFVIWVVVSISIYFSFPLSDRAPLVFHFGQNKCISKDIGCQLMKQNLDVFVSGDNDNSYASITAPSYLKDVRDSIPSAKNSQLAVIEPIGDQFVYRYSAPEPEFPIEESKLINVTLKENTSSKNEYKLKVQLNGYRSNVCVLSFYKQNVKNVVIKTVNSNNTNEELAIKEYNQNEIFLMRRDYNCPFEISFDYTKDNDGLNSIKLGFVCSYDDPKFIPAIQEINQNTPSWFTVSTTRYSILYLFKDVILEL